MNARILRKWSIHTKNLMSCSVCSLVVVVLLLLLLLVTCAPSLVLATTITATTTPTTTATIMNNNSPPHSLDASLVVNPMQQHYMPKNVIVVVDDEGAAAAKRTTRQTSASATASSLNTATSLSSQPTSQTSAAAVALAATTSSLTNRRSHRLVSPPRVEVADINDRDRESFPGFYTNHRITTDDIQPTPPAPSAPWPPLPVRHRLPRQQFNGAGANSGGGVVAPTWLMPANVNNNKDNILTRRMGWPSRLYTPSSSPTMLVESYNVDGDDEDDEEINNEDEEDDEEQQNDDDTLSSDNGDTGLEDDIEDSEDDTNNPQSPMSVRTSDRLQQQQQQQYGDAASSSRLSYTQHHFPVQQLYNLRRLDDRRPHVAPLQMPYQYPQQQQQQHDSPVATLSAQASQQQPQYPTVSELLHIPTPSPMIKKKRTMTKTKTTTMTTLYSYNNNPERRRTGGGGNIIFSTTDNKSVPAGVRVVRAGEEAEGGGGGGVVIAKDNVFDISNILNVNKIKSSAATSPIRFVIESYEVAAKEKRTSSAAASASTSVIPKTRLPPLPPAPPRLRQLRSRQLQQQQAARSRRDSLRGSNGYSQRYQHELPAPTSSYSFRRPASLHHHHQHNHHSLRLQRNRKHTRRYCSARDPAQLAFEAPTVFEGKIVSMTPDRRSNFSATVEVREVFKQQIGYRLQKYLRLQFAYRNSSGECDIYREQLRPRGLVKGDTIEPGRMYLLFVQQIDIGNFTILGQPIRKTKRVVEAVRNAVSENYAQLASIRSISASNRTVENGQELRIVCKVTGRPPPKVTWFKDHRSINRNRKLYQFTHFKKRSELIIRSFNTSDAGRYECRAKNKVNRNIERRAIVIKAYPVQRFDPNPRGAGNTCPDDASEFCFNGGTCKFFSEISSYSCICPEGFIGERCDRKEVNNPSTYSNEQECGDKKYFGSYYC